MTINDHPQLTQLQEKLRLKFKNPELLFQALTHRSYLNENRNLPLQSNERLEYLGDAILEFWISDTLFSLFPNYEEGDLTNLRALIVCTSNLADTAQSIDLGHYVLLSKGEETHQGRLNQSILADTFEAVLGAIYLDQGLTSVKKFLKNTLYPSIQTISQQSVLKDPKSQFQEIAQAKEGITPHYQTLKETGPDHDKIFEVGVYLDQRLIATGEGKSKQKAEESAAITATKILSNTQ
jgi:ribonuclease-3